MGNKCLTDRGVSYLSTKPNGGLKEGVEGDRKRGGGRGFRSKGGRDKSLRVLAPGDMRAASAHPRESNRPRTDRQKVRKKLKKRTERKEGRTRNLGWRTSCSAADEELESQLKRSPGGERMPRGKERKPGRVGAGKGHAE